MQKAEPIYSRVERVHKGRTTHVENARTVFNREAERLKYKSNTRVNLLKGLDMEFKKNVNTKTAILWFVCMQNVTGFNKKLEG